MIPQMHQMAGASSDAADAERVLGMLATISGDEGEGRVVIISGNPPSKARARFTKNGQVYTPKRTREGEKVYAAAFRGVARYGGNVAVACVFFRASYQRVDVDNLLKAVLDAATAAKVWDDDSQVTALLAVVEHDPGCPRAVVGFAAHRSSLKRGSDAMVSCEACGKPFLPAGHQRRGVARWCSRECRAVLSARVACPQCGQEFRRQNGNHKYCSVACRAAASRIPRPCARCGEPRAKRGSTLCRRCWLEGSQVSLLSESYHSGGERDGEVQQTDAC